MAQIVMSKKMLKELHGLFDSLRDEVRLNLTKEGIEAREVDPAHVGLVHIKVPKDKLAYYENEDGMSMVGIEMDWLPKIYRRGEEEGVAITWEAKKDVVLQYKIKGMPVVEHQSNPDLEDYQVKIPRFDNPCVFEVNSDDLSTIIAFADEFRVGHINIEAREGEVCLSLAGDTRGFVATLLTTPNTQERYKSIFPLDYFSNIIRACSFAEHYTVQLGNDYPIIIKGITRQGIEFLFMLAPRIESD